MPRSRQTVKSPPIGVLLSGGLDSAVLTLHLAQKNRIIWPVYVRCGLPWEKAEIFWTKKFLKSLKTSKVKELKVLTLSLEDAYESNWSKNGRVPSAKSADKAVFLPGRNLLLLTKSFLYLMPKKVNALALATLKGNPFPDATDKFFKKFSALLSDSFRRPVKVLRPFERVKKTTLIKKADRRALIYSFSCIAPKGVRHCGRCNKCSERRKAFRQAGLEELAFNSPVRKN